MAVTERQRAIKAMKKLYREYKASTDKDHTTFRNSVYFYSIFLNFLKHDAEMEFDDRLRDLEGKVNSQAYEDLKQAYGY